MSGCTPLKLSLVLCVLTAIGCATPVVPAPPVASAPASTPPTWYLTPPPDTETALYGVGSSAELPGAKSAALIDVAARLRISVRSRQVDRSVLHNDQLEQHIESELESRVRDREFRAYEVVENALSAGTYYTLVRIDRLRLIADTLAGLNELDREIASRLNLASRASPIAYKLAYGDLGPSLVRAAANVELLRMLDPAFDGAPLLARLRSYRAAYDRASREVVFELFPDADSTDVAQMVQELFAREGLQSEVIEDSHDGAALCRALCVEVATQRSSWFAARRYMTTLTSTFRVRDASGNVTAARSHAVKGTALSGYDEAAAAATLKLREDLERDGILRGIGLVGGEAGLRL
jgi:hypothetical protein